MIITFTNTKGGTGKSNLSAHLAIWLHERGIKVALLDTDHEQATSSNWVRLAEPEPEQAFVVACHFGVGYETLVNHLAYGLREIRSSLAERLSSSDWSRFIHELRTQDRLGSRSLRWCRIPR